MSGAKPIIVVLEDNPAAAEALRFILSDWGADVVHGECPEDIEGALGARICDIHCIIADFNLGRPVNGVDAARTLQARAPQARILVLTGSFKGRADAYAAAAGLTVMIKPANAKAIVAWLDQG